MKTLTTTAAAGRPDGINWHGYWQPVAYAPCERCRLTVQYNLAIGHLVHYESVTVEPGVEVVGCANPWPDCSGDEP